jgi:hypothetical protein
MRLLLSDGEAGWKQPPVNCEAFVITKARRLSQSRIPLGGRNLFGEAVVQILDISKRLRIHPPRDVICGLGVHEWA